ncbi:MAG: pseudouridine synthase [bacterium]|nr:pseudouridine synthase [bacterium]
MKPHQHFVVHKPYGVLSITHKPPHQQSKKDLSTLFPFPEGVHPIGRLDEDSEGLLLMTSNSKLMAYVNGAKFEKEYYVQLDGDITQEAIELMLAGLTLRIKQELVQTKPCLVKKLVEIPLFEPRIPPSRAGKHRPASWISVCIREGKFRQVRKMTAAVGFPTLRLIRVRIDNIKLGNLKVGEVQSLPEIIPFFLPPLHE